MTDLLTIGIGPASITFPVHESLIRKSSKFFDNIMQPQEASLRSFPRIINLTNQDPDIFKIYLHWLYCKTLPTVAVAPNNGSESEYVLLSKSYVLGEFLMDMEFKGALLDAFADCVENQPSSDPRIPGSRPVSIVYAGTKDKSPARQLLVHMWVLYADKDWVEYLNEDLPHTFVLDFSRAMLLQKCKLDDELKAAENGLMDYWKVVTWMWVDAGVIEGDSSLKCILNIDDCFIICFKSLMRSMNRWVLLLLEAQVLSSNPTMDVSI
jgi:hypothetical protein